MTDTTDTDDLARKRRARLKSSRFGPPDGSQLLAVELDERRLAALRRLAETHDVHPIDALADIVAGALDHYIADQQENPT